MVLHGKADGFQLGIPLFGYRFINAGRKNDLEAILLF